MIAESQAQGDRLISWVEPGMAVYDRYCEKLGTVKRVQLGVAGAFLEVETEPWPRKLHVTSEHISSIGFSRLWLRVTGAELTRA